MPCVRLVYTLFILGYALGHGQNCSKRLPEWRERREWREWKQWLQTWSILVMEIFEEGWAFEAAWVTPTGFQIMVVSLATAGEGTLLKVSNWKIWATSIIIELKQKDQNQNWKASDRTSPRHEPNCSETKLFNSSDCWVSFNLWFLEWCPLLPSPKTGTEP